MLRLEVEVTVDAGMPKRERERERERESESESESESASSEEISPCSKFTTSPFVALDCLIMLRTLRTALQFGWLARF